MEGRRVKFGFRAGSLLLGLAFAIALAVELAPLTAADPPGSNPIFCGSAPGSASGQSYGDISSVQGTFYAYAYFSCAPGSLAYVNWQGSGSTVAGSNGANYAYLYLPSGDAVANTHYNSQSGGCSFYTSHSGNKASFYTSGNYLGAQCSWSGSVGGYNSLWYLPSCSVTVYSQVQAGTSLGPYVPTTLRFC